MTPIKVNCNIYYCQNYDKVLGCKKPELVMQDGVCRDYPAYQMYGRDPAISLTRQILAAREGGLEKKFGN